MKLKKIIFFVTMLSIRFLYSSGGSATVTERYDISIVSRLIGGLTGEPLEVLRVKDLQTGTDFLNEGFVIVHYHSPLIGLPFSFWKSSQRLDGFSDSQIVAHMKKYMIGDRTRQHATTRDAIIKVMLDRRNLTMSAITEKVNTEKIKTTNGCC